jgi:hypothetical protein
MGAGSRNKREANDDQSIVFSSLSDASAIQRIRDIRWFGACLMMTGTSHSCNNFN